MYTVDRMIDDNKHVLIIEREGFQMNQIQSINFVEVPAWNKSLVFKSFLIARYANSLLHALFSNYFALSALCVCLYKMLINWMSLFMLEIKLPFIWYQTRYTLNNVKGSITVDPL